MKYKILFFLCTLNIQSYAQKSLSLQEAIQQGKIAITCKGNDKSAHYLKPLVMNLKNLSNSVLSLTIEAGSFFGSTPAEYQDITVTETIALQLNAQGSKDIEISGVCSEAGYAAPSSVVSYVLKDAPSSVYVQYARYINEQRFFGTYEAQRGMWALSDGGDWLIDGNTDETGKMGRKISFQVAKLKGLNVPYLTAEGDIVEKEAEFLVLENGKPLKVRHKITLRQPEPPNAIYTTQKFKVLRQGRPTEITHYCTRQSPEPDSIITGQQEFEMVENGQRVKRLHYITREAAQPLGEIVLGQKDYKVIVNGKVFSSYTRLITNQQPEPTCEMSGGASIGLARPAKVRLAMFDDKGVLVHEIFYSEKLSPGNYTLKYAYDCDRYRDKLYHFKIIKNDHIAMTYTMRWKD